MSKKGDIINVIGEIDRNVTKIHELYKRIINILAQYTDELKGEPWYYHNKFYKSDKSLSLIRNFFNKKDTFIKVLTD